MPFKDPEFKNKVVAALRNGKYRQVSGRLKTKGYRGQPAKHCCLGVICELLPTTEGQFDDSQQFVGNMLPEDKELPNPVDMGYTSDGYQEATPYQGNTVIPSVVAMRLGITGNEQRLLYDMNDNGELFTGIADIIEKLM